MNMSWHDKAACHGLDPQTFYPDTDEEADEAEVSGSVVQGLCLEYTLARREKEGVWGGCTDANAAGSSASAAAPPDPVSSGSPRPGSIGWVAGSAAAVCSARTSVVVVRWPRVPGTSDRGPGGGAAQGAAPRHARRRAG